MQKFFRISILLLVILGLLTPAVLRAEAAAYDPVTEGILCSYYHIDREKGFITGIAPGTSAEHLLSVCLPADCALSSQTLATGTTLTAQGHTLTVIVTGDLNGDAAVTITDMLMIKSAILGEPLSGTAAAAGDVNYDGSITITDFLQVKSSLLGLSSISAGRPADTASEPSILMIPGTSQSWSGGEGTVSYSSSDPAIAAIDANGTVTASAHGSAFVYGLDAQGGILSRVLVSVIAQPLTVSLDISSHAMTPGASLMLTPQLSHPVTATVAWASSDENVATVAPDGTVTAHNYGQAMITAALPNGSSAQAQIRVAPAISALSLDRDHYKLKPGNYRYPRLSVSPADSEEEIVWTSSDPSIAQVSSDGTIYGVSYGDVTITATGKYSGLSVSCTVSVCDVRQVAITFDDGPSGNTYWLLDYLKNHNIPATFFLVGEMIQYNPEAVVREAAEGHEIGYHSYGHQNQKNLTSEQIISDFNYTNQMLKDLTGKGFTLWRSPGGNYDQRVLNCIPLPHIYWSVDTRDWESRNADAVYYQIINNAWDGSIILLHDLYSTSVEGAIRGMDALLAAGYEFLTVTDLLSRDGTPPENSVNYYND